MAEAFQMREHGHARFVLHACHQALAASWHDDIDCAVEACQHGAHRGTVSGRDDLDCMFREAGCAQPLNEALMDRPGRVQGIRAAAEYDRVSGLQA